jgi:uncharacterized protein YbjQ (UPF0145 family)
MRKLITSAVAIAAAGLATAALADPPAAPATTAATAAPAAPATTAATPAPAAPATTSATPAPVAVDAGVPVYPYDITDRPYKVLGEVKVGVRKATIFSASSSQEKIYRILWKHAKEMGADAVINAKYGDAHISFMSWGQTDATGTAIKFVQPDAAAPK